MSSSPFLLCCYVLLSSLLLFLESPKLHIYVIFWVSKVSPHTEGGELFRLNLKGVNFLEREIIGLREIEGRSEKTSLLLAFVRPYIKVLRQSKVAQFNLPGFSFTQLLVLDSKILRL